MALRILVTSDRLAAEAKARLAATGADIRTLAVADGADGAAAVEAAMADLDPHGVLSRTLAVTERAMEAAPSLSVISKHGVGIDNIDLAAARRRGVEVVNAFGVNARAVAEHTFALMLALARNTARHDAAVRRGEWTRYAFEAHDLHGRRLALVGFGQSAQHVARIAAAFEMPVSAFSPRLAERGAPPGVRVARSFEALLEEAEILSLHLTATAQTRHLVDAAALERLPPGAWLINTSRGSIVDEAALVAGLCCGRPARAALDTFETEPLAAGSPLRDLANVLLTPHVSGTTLETTARVSLVAAENLVAALTRKGLIG